MNNVWKHMGCLLFVGHSTSTFWMQIFEPKGSNSLGAAYTAGPTHLIQIFLKLLL